LGRVSYGYINNVLNPLRLVLQEAVEDGLLPSNPAHKLNLQMRTKKKREKDLNPLSLSELSLLLDTLRQRHEDYYPLFLTVAHTGLRMGELRALMWSDVQFGQGGGGKNRYITVQRSYSHGHLSTPKSGRTRMVDLSKDLREILLSHQMKEYMKGRGQPEDLVFYGEEGGHISDSTVQRILKASLAIAGLRSVTFHSLRHSYATIMLYELGIPIQYVSHQLGHSSIKVTVDTYGHPRQGSNIAFVDGLSEQLSATSSQPVEQEAAQVPV
jgi:integrase